MGCVHARQVFYRLTDYISSPSCTILYWHASYHFIPSDCMFCFKNVDSHPCNRVEAELETCAGWN